MPRTQAEGDIPFTAISTGQINPMECVLLKMGVDVSEFTDPGAAGASRCTRGTARRWIFFTPDETTLVPDVAGGTATLDQYDQVIFPCWGYDPIGRAAPTGGGVNCQTANQQTNVAAYTAGGGRMFATHLSYSWFSVPATAPFDKTARGSDIPAGGNPDLEYTSGTANITHPSSAADVNTFYEWINALPSNGASGGAFPISQERNNFSAIGHGLQALGEREAARPPRSRATPTSVPGRYTVQHPLLDRDATGRPSAARSSTATST